MATGRRCSFVAKPWPRSPFAAVDRNTKPPEVVEQAQEHLTTATAMYREMEMTYWLEQAEAEMKECP